MSGVCIVVATIVALVPSTWKVTGGGGSYASLAGAGRGAAVWSPRGPLASRLDGFVQGG